MTPRPVIECDQTHTGLPVLNLAQAVDFYTSKLGFTLSFTWGEPATFAGLLFDKVELFLSQVTALQPPDICSAFFIVQDADALYAFHQANGVTIIEPIADRAYGIRDYLVQDLHGNRLMFGHHIYNVGPRVEVERVAVTARLEKRLAALLADLAAHKRMTIGECLEEMILHTNEGVGPHTKATLRHIEDLKRRHGIDYDCHASYRFVENASEDTKR